MSDYIVSESPDVAEQIAELLPTLHAHLNRSVSPHIKRQFAIEDFVQETARRAVEKQDSILSRDRNSLLAWLKRTAHRLIIDRIRSKRSHLIGGTQASAIYSALISSGDLTPSGECSATEMFSALRKAVVRLNDDHRQIILLRYQDQQSFKDIAATMNRTDGAIRGMHRRALKQLQKELGRESSYFIN